MAQVTRGSTQSLIKTNTRRGNYGSPQAYRGQSGHRPKRQSVKR
jgi:hypothetical protein